MECGDGVINRAAGEDCEEPSETATCDADCTVPECQDGVVNVAAGEICDDGSQTASCDLDCTPAECGDAYPNGLAGEQCDDGGETAFCTSSCMVSECGDGFVNLTAGEQCDEGEESATCDGDCTTVACGDGYENGAAGEHCDDGMPPADGDGCSATCQNEGVPNACEGGVDPLSGDPWVVCGADGDAVWVSHATNLGGNYHPALICAELGYAGYGQFGGTCGNVCGYCEGPTSCMAPGNDVFDGAGDCWFDGGWQVLCVTVTWQCIDP